MKNPLSFAGVLAVFVAPAIAYAQQLPAGGSSNLITMLTSIVSGIGQLVRVSLPIVFALAILAFFWGIFRYVFAHSMDDKKSGRDIMLWSLIAIFIMASLYGIVSLLQVSLGVGQTGSFVVPTVRQ